MSVVTLPRRVETRPRRTTTERTHRARRRGPLARWGALPIPTRVGAIVVATLLVLLAGSSYAAQRQVQLHTLQSALLQDQSNYAAKMAALTNASAPAKVASQAGHLHLVVPALVTQIPAAPLNRRLPLPRLDGIYSVNSRTLR